MWAWKVYISAFIWFMIDSCFLFSKQESLDKSVLHHSTDTAPSAWVRSHSCDKHNDEWRLISYQGASDFWFYWFQTQLCCFSSIQKILASSVSSYCFCNKISHTIATADHLPFHTHKHTHAYFMCVGLLFTIRFCRTIKGFVRRLRASVHVGLPGAHCSELSLFFRMPSRAENALLIC